MLDGQDAIHGFERKLTPAMQEVGEMRLSKAGLPCEERDAYSSSLDPPQQLEAKTFMHLGKIHLWKLHRQQWIEIVRVFYEQRNFGVIL